MAIVDEQQPIWEEIDRAENYLVCCMFSEATSLASSTIKRLREDHDNNNKGCEVLDLENEWVDMVEAAGMVFVQSMKQLQRTSEILEELKLLFGSLTAIPVQVFLTGVCFQMSESPSTSVQDFLEEFLNNWRYMDDQYYPLAGEDASVSDTDGYCLRFSIGVDKYLEVVELYVIAFLANTIKHTDLAISWVEKAVLPTENRQELLRQLQSLNSSVSTSSSQTSMSPRLADEYRSDLLRDQRPYSGHQKDIESKYLPFAESIEKEKSLKFSRKRIPYFWWFRTVSLKLGSTRLVVPTGKMLLASLLLLFYYVTRKKQAVLKRVLAEKAMSIKKALLDLWQLAFSYQVNPLAAVQTLPTPTRGH